MKTRAAVSYEPGKPLVIEDLEVALRIKREDLHLTGTKYGCGVGSCGAMTISGNTANYNAQCGVREHGGEREHREHPDDDDRQQGPVRLHEDAVHDDLGEDRERELEMAVWGLNRALEGIDGTTASVAEARSLSMTASTPESSPSRRTTGIPPPPAAMATNCFPVFLPL